MVFDDYVNVLENRAIRYLGHPRVFLESEHSRSRPLPYITFAISYALNGLSLSWLRVWSVALHLGSAVLTGLLYRRWIGGNWGALLAGAILLLHPMAADTVIYFSARGSVLVLFFLLLALFAHGLQRQGPLSWALFLGASVCAFLSRESAIALIPILLLVHRLERRPWIALLPYVSPLIAGGLVLLWRKASFLDSAYRGVFAVQGDLDVNGPFEYIRLSLSIWPKLIGLFFMPKAQSIDHQIFAPVSWADPAVFGGMACWLAFLFTIYRAWSARSWAWLAPAWFFLALIPTNSIFPLLDPFSERHFYIALPAFAFGAAWLLSRISPLHGARVLAPAVMLVLLGAGIFTLPRIQQWGSPTELWLDAHRKAPGKFRVAYNGALSLLMSRDDGAGALQLLGETFARLMPGDLTYEQQEEGLRTATSVVQSLASARGVSAVSLLEGFPEGFWRALLQLRCKMDLPFPSWDAEWRNALAKIEALPLSPRSRDPNFIKNSFLLLKAEALRKNNQRKEAVKTYEAVILPYGNVRHFPYWTAREPLGLLYLEEGREPDAIRQFELAVTQYKVFKRFPLLMQRKLYEIYIRRGDTPRASDAIGELVRVYTDDVPLRRLYAELLLAKQDRHAARQAREADFYSKHAVSPTDERELLRP